MARAKKAAEAAEVQAHKRQYLKQSDVPAASLDDALRIPRAILDHYAGEPTVPLLVAKALNIDPGGTQLKVLSGAAIAFGLTEGGSQANAIAVQDLARRIIRPKVEGEDQEARREAILKPRVFGEVLRKYDGHPLPRADIAQNVLEDMGVPRDRAQDVFARIVEDASSVGLIQEISGKQYVHLGTSAAIPKPEVESEEESQEPASLLPPDAQVTPTKFEPAPPKPSVLAAAIVDDQRRRRVFVTHGKNKDLVEPIKKLLEYGELEPVVSVERTSVSKPVPEKVMGEMRSCGAAIIHVDAEKVIRDDTGTDHVVINPNVLIEIGAAMAFYGRRFILLVREGVNLPSNLQGLYEVRYKSDALDAEATIRLLEAIKDIKNYSLPSEEGLEE